MESIKNSKEALKKIKDDPSLFKDVPKDLITEDFCLKAVIQNGKVLEFIPPKLKTPELCLKAVESKGTALKYVPMKLRTVDMCLIAVKKFGLVIDNVPKDFKASNAPHAFDIWLAAVEAEKSSILLKYVPKDFQDQIVKAVQKKGNHFHEMGYVVEGPAIEKPKAEVLWKLDKKGEKYLKQMETSLLGENPKDKEEITAGIEKIKTSSVNLMGIIYNGVEECREKMRIAYAKRKKIKVADVENDDSLEDAILRDAIAETAKKNAISYNIVYHIYYDPTFE